MRKVDDTNVATPKFDSPYGERGNRLYSSPKPPRDLPSPSSFCILSNPRHIQQDGEPAANEPTDVFADDNSQGRVRTKTTKRASRVLIEKYYPRLTLDFHTNKRIIDEVAVVPSKRLRNKISGFTTHLMKRIQKGPVRGISFKLQEEERERKDNYVPEVSALDTSATGLEVDAETKELLHALNFDTIQVSVIQPAIPERAPRRERRNVPGAGR
ncbi:ribosomal S17-domain-containing protein [Armillaria borealis]|uniref:Ribosomal S17-domain-containing protein n=1 Tax=Armillaria borealis TaxID=47425 RepID=A0AA39JYV0_9AGAR|nr:ribosomal S17-domain-containing protein [Armillaria borealis]